MFKGKTVSLTLIDNGFAEITFDNQGDSVNKFNTETLADLRQAVDALKAQDGVRGV